MPLSPSGSFASSVHSLIGNLPRCATVTVKHRGLMAKNARRTAFSETPHYTSTDLQEGCVLLELVFGDRFPNITVSLILFLFPCSDPF